MSLVTQIESEDRKREFFNTIIVSNIFQQYICSTLHKDQLKSKEPILQMFLRCTDHDKFDIYIEPVVLETVVIYSVFLQIEF